MDFGITVTQTAPVSANAGLQQNISVSSPSADYFSGASTSNTPIGQNGPGWATVTGAPATVSSATSSLSSANWPFYFFMAAVAWFAFRKLGS